MDIARAQVELVLRGKDAGLSHPSVPPERIASIASELLARCGRAWFADPDELASELGLELIEAPLMDELDVCCSGHRILIKPQEDVRERGLLALRGIASYVLSVKVGRHTEADVLLLVAEMAAPSDLVIRRGVRSAVERYKHVPHWFLRAWERAVAGTPSSQAFST